MRDKRSLFGSILRYRLNDQLRCVGTCLAARQTDRRAAGRRKGNVVGTVACDQGGEIDTGPYATIEGS